MIFRCVTKSGEVLTLRNLASVEARADIVAVTIEAPPRKNKPKRTSAPPRQLGDFLRCLCVRPPWAGQIVDGQKVEEYRSTKTKIRGVIGIIETGSGLIIGQVDLYDCTDDAENFRYIWHLRNAERFATPRPYQHPGGAVNWVKVPL